MQRAYQLDDVRGGFEIVRVFLLLSFGVGLELLVIRRNEEWSIHRLMAEVLPSLLPHLTASGCRLLRSVDGIVAAIAQAR